MEVAKNIIFPWRWVSWFGGKKSKDDSPSAEEKLEMRLRPYQQYLYKFQELVLWKKPYETVLFLACLQCVFLLLASMKLRFYCVTSWTALALVLHEAWIYRIWPVIKVENPEKKETQGNQPQQPPEGMLSVPELSKCATCIHSFTTSSFTYLKSLRATHPSAFCGIMVSALLVLIQVGSAVSGFWLLYMLIMFSVLSPGVVFRLMSPQTREWLASIFTRIAVFLQPKDGDAGVEEYLPEQSKENLSLFHLASGDNVEKTNVSTPSSDMDVLPVEPIPSHDESSLDRDYSLSLDPRALEAASRLEDSILSFRPTHFNGSTLSAALKRALADTLSPAPIQEHSDSEHSDSSEFELIEPEDDPNPT